jgi:hypothetical protein
MNQSIFGGPDQSQARERFFGGTPDGKNVEVSRPFIR